MTPARARLWHALSLGPLWRLRGASDEAPDDDGPRGGEARAGGSAGPAAVVRAAADPIAEPVAGLEAMDWQQLQSTVAACRRCSLCETRTQTVFEAGSRSAPWMMVGEAPGAEEDARGEPFVGQAGRLLDNMLAAAGRSRSAEDESAVYIANVLKCRPPGNRNPLPEEVARCQPFLKRQIALLRPRLIVVMGRFAAQSLLGTDAAIASLRGRAQQIDVAGQLVPVVVTYHPAYLLRNLADKAKAWADLCLAQEIDRRVRSPDA